MHDVQVEWCMSDGIGRPTVQREHLDAVLQTAAGRNVVVLVPGQEVVLTEVDLPIRQRAKFLQAVPYALEEQLAEDVEKLHFAAGDRQAGDAAPVLVVSRQLMDQWLAPFKAAGIQPVACIPDMLCMALPASDKHWSVMVEGNHCLVRTAQYMGFACDTDALPDYMGLADAGADLNLQIATIDGDLPVSLAGLPVHSVDVDRSMRFGLEALGLSPSAGINLLQGAYSADSRGHDWWRPFRLTATLALAWVVLATASQTVDYFTAKSSLAEVENQNLETIGRLFPEIKTLVPGSEQVQLERRLNELRGQGNQDGLFLPLTALAKALQTVGNLELQELQLREGALYISLTAKNITTLEKLKAHFASTPAWVLDVQAANAGSDGVQIRASLRGSS